MYDEKNMLESVRMSEEISARLKDGQKARRARPSPKTAAKRAIKAHETDK